ncbi:ribosome biogenesis protein ytm1 [Malassezia sp. CBS 17886]|nr:ribosome biogenesis protein ytm1 [Malassezia sp. CBS 17886]
MAEDVAALLASVGSPLVDANPVDAQRQQKLPASAVLALLDARLEASGRLVDADEGGDEEAADRTPPTGGRTPPLCPTVDASFASALRTYAEATRQYTQASVSASITAHFSSVVDCVGAWQDTVAARDAARLSATAADVETALRGVGLELDISRGTLRNVPGAPYADLCTTAAVQEMCEQVLAQMRAQRGADWDEAVSVSERDGAVVVSVAHADRDKPWTARWDYAVACGFAEQVADTVAATLRRVLIHCVLDGDLRRRAVETQGTDAAAPVAGAAHPAAVRLVVEDDGAAAAASAVSPVVSVLRLAARLFRDTARGAPETDAPLAPTLQVLVAHRIVPELVAHVKEYILRCRPTHVATPAACAAVEDGIRAAVHEVHGSLVSLGYARDRSAPVRTARWPGWSPTEPLSDLPEWTKTVAPGTTKLLLAGLLAEVRAAVAVPGDAAWEACVVARAPRDTVGGTGRPFAASPGSVRMEREQKRARPPPPGAQQEYVADEGRKRPVDPPLGCEDDWGWGDEDGACDGGGALAAKETASPDASPRAASDAGPQRDGAPSLTVPTPPHAADPPPDEFDAWDWSDGETDVAEVERELAGEGRRPAQQVAVSPRRSTEAAAGAAAHARPTAAPPPAPPPADAPTPFTVSQRGAAVAQHIAGAWRMLEHADAGSSALYAEGVVDMIRIFRAMMPVVHAHVLQHVALLSILFAHDCTYLAEEALKYADRVPRLPVGVRASMRAPQLPHTLREEAHMLADVGAAWRQAQLTVQVLALRESLDGADQFARTDEGARFEQCARAVQQVAHTLQHLANVWAPVVARDELAAMLGGLVDDVFARTLANIQGLDDISEVESTRLAHLCRVLLDQAAALFAQIGGAAAAAAADDGASLAAAVVPRWLKFSYLAEILTGSLADIEFLLFDPDAGGALSDYTRDEMGALVRALFADTPNRRRLLGRIGAGG